MPAHSRTITASSTTQVFHIYIERDTKEYTYMNTTDILSYTLKTICRLASSMDDFTFPTFYAGGQLLPSAFRHQLGGSPLPWFLAGEEEEEEEKMDMLWEDFNEELASVPPLCPLSPVINKGSALAMKEAAGWLGDCGDMIVVDLEKKHGKGKHPLPQPQDSRVVRRRKWSLRLMLRLLKKLFLVNKSRNPRTAPAPM